MGYRRKGRECALQALFQMDLSGDEFEDIFPLFWEGKEELQDIQSFAEKIVKGVRSHISMLDAVLSEHAENWRLNRMAIVDRNVLRIALYEFLFEPDTPLVVIIDEAIEIAKKFGSEESGAFINGVLDAVKKKIESSQIKTARPEQA